MLYINKRFYKNKNMTYRDEYGREIGRVDDDGTVRDELAVKLEKQMMMEQ